MTENPGRGAGGDPKGSLTDKRKASSSHTPSGVGGASATSGNGSYRPPQASSPGAHAVAGAALSALSTSGAKTSPAAVGSVLPPPVTEPGKATSAGSSPTNLDILAERYASLADDAAFSADEAVDRQIAGLEAWCRAAIWRERRDLARFWLLRTVAFVGVTVASAAPYLPGSSPALPLTAGSLAVVALAIDSAWPPPADRVSRHRAIRELRELQHTLRLKWDKVRLAHPERYSPKRIAHALALLDAAQAKREEIGGYLNDSSPGVSG